MQKTIELKGVTFAKLTRGERAAINADLIAKRREKTVANLTAAGLKGEELFNELENFDDTPHGLAWFVRHVNSGEGQADIQVRCLKKLKPDATEDDLPELDDVESLQLACDLSGLKLASPAPVEPPEDPPKVPSEADVYAQ